MYSFFLVIVHILISRAFGQVTSPTHTYNITSPDPNAFYVAGQILPITYTLVDNPNLPTLLSLSVYFSTQDASLNASNVVITENADISQGFSFRRTANTMVYYEHQLNYLIPNATRPGNYQVVFQDAISRTNTSVPIVVRPYAAPAANPSGILGKAKPSGSFALQNNPASPQFPITPSLLATLVLLSLYFASYL
ncbi:uncharacterized protein BYT42DRAFT_557669 [Radiomyces spectabilis]|uniref:uncharacterized protein n=1 Tax=Radiomyces spectabilis TaxID=64574 RepID=UPI0022209F38|nr:uncharacterized protein BYT42DRAFT_557669 [Radiomyces spectabilis]KAI8391672.1 hypothetical protein BYT42DRAFT_557669 [Radiomyces spectabilis]